MQILAVRHGKAEDAEEFSRSGWPDHSRSLTARGRKRMELAARGLTKLVTSIDLLATSPYLRAVQTAEVLSLAYGNIAIQQIPQLEAGAPLESLTAWLTEQHSDACIALVGHAPDLACLITYLTGNREAPVLKIKKGGACLVSFSADLQPGEGMMRWLMDADQLGRVAG
jgi:phosphohistidine phosphatase